MLITLEGIDGSGKTTVWRALKENLDAVFTREPTDSWYGDAVQRSIETDDADPMAELFLYMADHADHLDRVIRPALDRGACVVSDRYVDSRVAYQSVTLADRLDDPAATIDALHADWSRAPDLTIYLDVEPRVALERSAAANKFERLEHLEAVAATYEDRLASDPERFVRVDASEPPAVVHDRVRAIVRDAIERSGRD